MQHFISARHGSDTRGKLDFVGERQANGLGERIKEKLPEVEFTIASSVAARAYPTSCIIAECLSISVEQVIKLDSLWDDDEHTGDTIKSLNTLDLSTNLIVISHLHIARRLINAIIIRNNLPIANVEGKLANCEGWHLDLGNKTCTKI